MPPTDPNADLLPHEIAGPVWYLPYPLPVMIAAGVVLLLAVALALWVFIRWRRSRTQSLDPRQAALVALKLLRSRSGAADPYEFSIAVCEVVRSFLAAQHSVPAPKLTSYEFLQAVQKLSLFDEDCMSKLTSFLEKVDGIKFAHADATAADNDELTALAEDLVKGEVPDAVAS
jgi:hypothetical protein